MIRFERLEAEADAFRLAYLTATPFPHLVVDDFCEADRLNAATDAIPELERQSRDYAFAHNKFEKSGYWELSDEFHELHEELRSERFNRFLSYITNRPVFVDPENFGGGLHQGKSGSWLDMHLDFNYHPQHDLWYRELNLLLYLNGGWIPEHGGSLRLRDLRTDETTEIGVPFNRLVVQRTSSFTLHGYDATSFPEGRYRTSIATYAYEKHQTRIERARTTDWYPSADSGVAKRLMARHYGSVVRAKNRVLGSGTARNR